MTCAARRRAVSHHLAILVLAAATTAPADTLPTVSSEPDVAILAGASDTATFTATADGTPAPTVQWQYSTRRDGSWTDIAGATSATLTGTATTQAGQVFSFGNAFRAVFTNSAGTAVSHPAKLVWRTEWMRDLGDDIAKVPLSQLTIPGAHDMGTYGIDNFSAPSSDGQVPGIVCDSDHEACVRYGEAQNPSADAEAELNQGIRYFDLRVCFHPIGDTGLFITCHGLEGGVLSQILGQTRAWIDAHPYDVVFLDFNHHFDLDVETEAAAIEQAFALPGASAPVTCGPGGNSLLIPPQYCTPGDPTTGTCVNNLALGIDLTLGSIDAQGLGRVIVNFENDGAPTSNQPTFGVDFYDNHPCFWGRAASQPAPFSFSSESCTRSGSVTSCFGNDSDVSTVLGRVKTGLANFGYTPNFIVQFLQTTPDAGYISHHVSSSLDDMAQLSNPIIGPALFGCDATNPNCLFSEFLPENMNILPINFYNDTDYKVFFILAQSDRDACNQGLSTCPLTPARLQTLDCGERIALNVYLPGTCGPDDCFLPDLIESGAIQCTYYDPVHFDYVEQVIRFDEYARTPPVVGIEGALPPASTGWYNAAVLGGQGKPLSVNVVASDYRYLTGITALTCSDNSMSPVSLTPGTTAPFASGTVTLHDGNHSLTCASEDGATEGYNGTGNTGAGPGSTEQPAVFRVDTVPPVITCNNPHFLLHQPAATVAAIVTDATSGPAAASLSKSVSTDAVGTFTVSFTAYDVAGNSTTGSCSYTVSYGVALLYNSDAVFNTGSTIPIHVALVDYFGNDVSAKSIPVTALSVTNTTTNATFAPTSKVNRTFAFITTPKSYLYGLATKGVASGSYTLDFAAGSDPVEHHAPFMLR